ncbi:MAG: molybdopterin molybdenumtransferase MoeA, partial [Pseudomonadota bacterium]
GHVFLRPMLRAMQGLPKTALPTKKAPLAAPVGKNGPREHFMRGVLSNGAITVFDRQDSSLLSVLAAANVLVVRPKFDGALEAGTEVDFIDY